MRARYQETQLKKTDNTGVSLDRGCFLLAACISLSVLLKGGSQCFICFRAGIVRMPAFIPRGLDDQQCLLCAILVKCSTTNSISFPATCFEN